MVDEIKNTIDIIETLETRINTYWNFYFIVVLAVIGWLMSSRTPFTESQGIALTVAISLFLIANLSVIRAATKRVMAFESELKVASTKQEFHSSALKEELSHASIGNRLFASYLLHGVIDIAVIYAIWSKLD